MCFGLQHKYEKGEKNGDQLVKSEFRAQAMGSNSLIGCMLQNCAKGLGLSMKTNQYVRLIWLVTLLVLAHVLIKSSSIFQVQSSRKRHCYEMLIFLHSWLCNPIFCRHPRPNICSVSAEFDVRCIISVH